MFKVEPALKLKSGMSIVILFFLVSISAISVSKGTANMQATGDNSSGISLITPTLVSQKSWKISNAEGPFDWSPVENVMAVEDVNSADRGRIVLYSANGSALFTVADFNGIDEYVSPAKFSSDGSKIGYFHHPYGNTTSELHIFDIKTRTQKTVALQGKIYDFDWAANAIIYMRQEQGKETQDAYSIPASYQISRHDLNTGAESSIVDSTAYFGGLDVSPDGNDIAFTRSIPVDRPCTHGEHDSCSISQLVLVPLSNRSRDAGNLSSTTNTSSTFHVIAQITSPDRMWSPKWTPDGSKVTYATGFRCSSIQASSKDGSTNQTLISWERTNAVGGCYNFGIAFNKDSSLVAYSIGYAGVPFNEDFHPVNAGLYLSFTELCKVKECAVPTKTIPTLTGESLGGISIMTRYGSPSYLAYLKAGYEEYVSGIIDEKERKLTIVLKNPRSGQADERDVTLYLPSRVIDGDMTVFVNGTQLHPGNPCISDKSAEYCSKVTATIDKIEGWSIISIKDDTTGPREIAEIDILGTTAIPEFGSSVTFAMAAISSVVVIVTSKLYLLKKK